MIEVTEEDIKDNSSQAYKKLQDAKQALEEGNYDKAINITRNISLKNQGGILKPINILLIVAVAVIPISILLLLYLSSNSNQEDEEKMPDRKEGLIPNQEKPKKRGKNTGPGRKLSKTVNKDRIKKLLERLDRISENMNDYEQNRFGEKVNYAIDLIDSAKNDLEDHKAKKARTKIKKAESIIEDLEFEVR